MKIQLVDKRLKHIIPGYVWQQQSFNFSPLGFGIDTGSQELVYTKDVQRKSVVEFLANPFGSQNFIITGHLDDAKALYLGAYLIQGHLKKGGSNPLWITLNSDLRDYETLTEPSLVCVSNITNESTPARFQKCRDIIYKFYNCPRIIIGCGLDPIRFGAQRLHIPVNKIVYFKSGLDADTITVE